MLMNKSLVALSIFSFVLLSSILNAQNLGGQSSFPFLNLPNSARQSALRQTLGVLDRDNSSAIQNPATLNSHMDKVVQFSNLFHFDGVNSVSLNYSQQIVENTWYAHAAIQSLNYGDFTRTDVTGTATGSFRANDLAVLIGAGYQLYDRMKIGVNIKYISSSYAEYSASALAGDLGLVYHIEEKKMSVALVANHIGAPISRFVQNSRQVLPTNVQLAFTKQFEHLPLRYSIIYHHLNSWDFSYTDKTSDDTIFGFDDDQDKEAFSEQLLKHFIVNAELLIGKREGLVLRASYDFLRRSELLLDGVSGPMGLAFGVGIRLGKFRLDYGRAVYHHAGTNNHLSFSTSINHFIKDHQLN